jgi:hypothetical protein
MIDPFDISLNDADRVGERCSLDYLSSLEANRNITQVVRLEA